MVFPPAPGFAKYTTTKLKSGTKFERLTALVFQILNRSALVIQDVVLRGPGKEAEHQIDVTAQDRHGNRKRVIVEARDS